jgi:NAD(P)-dependent dehydrogenase (short-subunit alcohol dehydrogenase family)
MAASKSGHIVNISSIVVITNAPRFSAYLASKAALDAWTHCAASEFAGQGVSFTTVNMPLVRTPMIASTSLYDSVPTLTLEEAADLIVKASIFKPPRIASQCGWVGQLFKAVLPRVAQPVMNTGFRLAPESGAAGSASPGEKAGKYQLSREALALQQLLREIHF